MPMYLETSSIRVDGEDGITHSYYAPFSPPPRGRWPQAGGWYAAQEVGSRVWDVGFCDVEDELSASSAPATPTSTLPKGRELYCAATRPKDSCRDETKTPRATGYELLAACSGPFLLLRLRQDFCRDEIKHYRPPTTSYKLLFSPRTTHHALRTALPNPHPGPPQGDDVLLSRNPTKGLIVAKRPKHHRLQARGYRTLV